MRTLNRYQKAVARTYGGGDYAYLAERTQVPDRLIDQCGDTLFKFLMIELSDGEDCENKVIALQRLDSALRDIEGAMAAVEGVEE